MKPLKISKALLGALGVGVIACLLIAATLLVLHQPILQENGWSGTQPISTTPPTAIFFPPAPGWSKDILPILSPQGTPTLPTRAATKPLPPGIPTDTPSGTPNPHP
jgi:hypothetical protein